MTYYKYFGVSFDAENNNIFNIRKSNRSNYMEGFFAKTAQTSECLLDRT